MPEENTNGLHGEFVLSREKKESEEPNSEHEKKNNPDEQRSKIDLTVPRSKSHFFSSLIHYPEGVVFQNQDEDEDVILVVRRDFITNVPWIISIILLAALPPLLFIFAPLFFPSLNVSPTLIFLTFAFYYLIVFEFALLYFAIWYFNVGIVTNKRVIDVDVQNILSKETSEVRLNSIADVTYNQVGSIRSFFNYGDVHVQVEALQQHIEFDRAPDPNRIRKIIGDTIVDEPS